MAPHGWEVHSQLNTHGLATLCKFLAWAEHFWHILRFSSILEVGLEPTVGLPLHLEAVYKMSVSSGEGQPVCRCGPSARVATGAEGGWRGAVGMMELSRQLAALLDPFS